MLEETFEDEAMAEVKPPVVARITGSTGTNPLTDGTFRSQIIGLPAYIVGFTNLQWHWIASDDALTALVMVVAPLGTLLWALFDRFVKPRILSS